MRLLLVEDEPGIGQVVKQGLEEAKYQVDWATDGSKGLEMATENTYAAILLDVMLPKMDGWEICRELRSRKVRIPIMMLTARDSVDDRVKGLDIGADDYLPKPFEFDELLARVRALLRRDKVNKSRVIRVADLEIDTGSHIVKRAGQEIALTRREYTLLEALAAREGQVLTREIIQERVWMDEESYSNTVDVYIGSLRKKIDAPFERKLIHTVHGLGYTVKVPEDE